MADVTAYLPPLLLLLLTATDIVCHPQCLDFRAPFRPDKNVSFCLEYSKLGCCSSQDEIRIIDEYTYIKSRADPGDWHRCQVFVKDILCQKCSPYAAHIYDAEGTSQARQFPGLCAGYCHGFYDTCKDLVAMLDPGTEVIMALANKDRFCQQVAIPDALYCYPDLLTQPLLLRNLTSVHSPSPTSGCLCLEPVGSNLANPLWAGHAGDGSGRLFVAEQKGRVRIYNTRSKKWKKSCFLDYSKKAVVSGATGDERGFLGLAFHPQYSKNGRFFVYYSTRKKSRDVLPQELQGRKHQFDTKIVISEARVSPLNRNKADAKFERILLEVFQPFENHNGGQLMFGLDGYLYAFIGDGGGAGDPMNAGQNKSLLHGKVLRLDVDSDPSQPYTIPADNPFVGEAGARPEIYAYGIRNIWRCGLDRAGESKGQILCGDVGQNAYEEIDVLKKGANYGWNAREGFECYDEISCGRIGPEELPIHAYSHTIGQSVTGGVFYRGCENPALLGQYIYGDFSSSRLFSLTESAGVWVNSDVSLCGPSLCQGGYVGSFIDFLLSFGEDEDGEIYLLASKSASSAECDGTLYKIVDPVRRNDPSSCSSDPSRSRRIQLSRRGKVSPTAQSNQLDANPSIAQKAGDNSSSSHVHSYETNTSTSNQTSTPNDSQPKQRRTETERPHDHQSQRSSSSSSHTSDILSKSNQNDRSTAGKTRDGDGNPSAQSAKSGEMYSSTEQKSSLKETIQSGSRQSSSKKLPSGQRKRGKQKPKRRGHSRKMRKTCRVCGGQWSPREFYQR